MCDYVAKSNDFYQPKADGRQRMGNLLITKVIRYLTVFEN